MVTREEVVMAYRLLLGREPESEAAVTGHMAAHKDWQSLRKAFISTPEFAGKLGQAGGGRTFLTGSEPPMLIDLDVPDDTMEALLEHVQQSWTALGREEPHWAVLTTPAYTKEKISENRDSFYRSGRNDAERFKATLKRSHLTVPKGRCFELGCGVGRVTRWLAPLFDEVVAADISGPMLELARQYLVEQEIDNVTTVHFSAISDLVAVEPFDAFFSVIVIQHNPPPIQDLILRSLLSKLRPGGVAYFQVPTYAANYYFNVRRFLSPKLKPGMEMHPLPQYRIFEIAAAAGLSVVEVAEDGWVGNALWRSNTFVLRRPA